MRDLGKLSAGAFALLVIGSTQQIACAQNAGGDNPFEATAVADFEAPWAMEFLPDGRLLVTEKAGSLKVVSTDGQITGEVSGVPEVVFGGQGGFGDVVLHPDYEDNDLVYLSYAEAGAGNTAGAAVARAKLELAANGGGSLEDLEVIWRQEPKVTGQGHYSHRIAFGPDGYLYVSSGDRQKGDPAQDLQANLGKVLRLNDDGSVPGDNPFAERGGVAAQVWSLGHRNLLGLVFDAQNRLWDVEMGPRGGDEVNLVMRGENYGWPIVSNGDDYSGAPIPDHPTRPEFKAPAVFWNPSISPSSMIFYSGSEFPEWQGDAFIGGLSSQALIRVEIDGESAREAARYPMGARIRSVEQGPDGALWVLEDGGRGSAGRLLKLTQK